jgi:hypothetical protein
MTEPMPKKSTMPTSNRSTSSANNNPYTLSIMVDGDGLDLQNGADWSFFIRKPSLAIGRLLNIRLIDKDHLIYVFEQSNDVAFPAKSSEGWFDITTGWNASQYKRACDAISMGPAPRNGWDGCHDWIGGCVGELEAERLVRPGTVEWVRALVGLSTAVARRDRVRRWISVVHEPVRWES